MITASVFTSLDVELKPNPARSLIRPSGFGYPAAFDRKPTRTQHIRCGAILHERRILLPYAIGDEYGAFTTGSVDDLLSMMEWFG